MSDLPNPQDPNFVALTELIAETAALNVVLTRAGWPPVTLPDPRHEIQPFFADMIALIQRITLAVAELTEVRDVLDQAIAEREASDDN